jgi:predicted DNA-binding protein (MmcQ/YjbR family)
MLKIMRFNGWKIYDCKRFIIMIYRQDVIEYIKWKYNVEPEYLWKKFPNYAVFRNPETRKRFWLIWDVDNSKLQTGWEWRTDVLNVKSDPWMIQYLKTQWWYRPAYHMNKENRISLLLWPLSTKEDTIKTLIDISYKFSCKDWEKLLWLIK